MAHSLKQTRAELEASDVYLPRFVWRELEAITSCGVIERGFVRVVCSGCKHERLLGFSCKGRAVCSSCVGRKMNELSLHLMDHVVPDVPLRQFVLTLPFGLRLLVARDKRLLAAVRTVFLRAVSGFVRKKAREAYPSKTLLTAGLCVVQRFGSALQLAPHFHAALFDGAYRADDDGKLHFVAAPAITPAERLALTTRIASRMERMLARRGLFLNGQWTAQDDAGLQLSMEAMKVPAAQGTGQPVSNASNVRGYNLHAQTRVSAHDEPARLRLFRYILRPAIAQDRLHFENGLVTFTMKRVFSDGSQVLRFTPQAFIRRIAMLVPAPRQHEITYFGLLAANAKHRSDIVRVATHRRVPTVRGDENVANAASTKTNTPLTTMTWAQLLTRTFAFDVLHCEKCGGRARVVAAITERAIIDKILTHLRAASGNPGLARAPPVLAQRQAILL